MSRNKGKRGEREVVKLLQAVIDGVQNKDEKIRLQRNSLQSDGGGMDIVGLEGYAIEVKYQENLQLEQWWRQTVVQSKGRLVPVLVYRKSHSPWRVRTYGVLPVGGGRGVKTVVDVSIQDFLGSVKVRLMREKYERANS